eukprot:2477888-Amphidinium_carterae.1
MWQHSREFQVDLIFACCKGTMGWSKHRCTEIGAASRNTTATSATPASIRYGASMPGMCCVGDS